MSEYDGQITKPTEPKVPVPYVSALANQRNEWLDVEEVKHFKRHGFIVKKGLIDDDGAFERIVDYVWDTVPDGVMTRDDPKSWWDNPHEKWPVSARKRIGVLSHGAWKMRSKHEIGLESILCDTTANHPCVRNVVKQFLGDDLIPCHRVRGVYVIFPKSCDSPGRLGPHVDHAAAQLSAMVIVAKTGPREGGFTVWPGSHERLHRFWLGSQHAHFNPETVDEFKAEFQQILRDTKPVEFIGDPGDVVFWHPRLIHSAGVNYSAETDSPRIRYAIPCDFQKNGRTFYDDDDLGPGTTHQWWVDTRHFREDPPPTTSNLWTDWEI